jgi:uncharacterized membrane protein YbhN (UPF0104 family)
VAAIALVVGALPPSRSGQQAGRPAGAAFPSRHRPGEGNPGQPAASVARPVRADRAAFLEAFGFTSADLLSALLSLDLMFRALGYQPGFGPLVVAYAAANLASAIPVTPDGLGVIEVTAGSYFRRLRRAPGNGGACRARLPVVNYWLPLLPGPLAYLHLRPRPTARRKAISQAPSSE